MSARSAAIGFLAMVAPLPALAQPSVDPAADLQSILLSLALIVALIVGAAYVLKRTPLGQAARVSGPLKIVASLALGPRERLLLVEVHGVEMLVAIGPSGTAIAPADPARAAAPRDARGDELERALSFGDRS